MKPKYLILLVILVFFLKITYSQNNKGFSYSLKSAINFLKIPGKAIDLSQNNKNTLDKQNDQVPIHDLIPRYVDNMIWDQNIVQVPGGLPNQILNETWAYGHFVDQNQNWSTLFGNLEGLLFLPYGYHDTMTTVLALDSRRCTIFYFDKDNISSGVQHYGTEGKNDNNFSKPSAFVLGREEKKSNQTNFNMYICDEINNRVVHVVYKAIPGNNHGFDGTPFDTLASIIYPSDISYFHCQDTTKDKLWIASEQAITPAINCIDIQGNKLQNIAGYRDQNGEDYLFLPDTHIKLSVFDYYFKCLAFIDTRRNYLVTCLLDSSGTGNVVSIGNGQYVIQAQYITFFPDDLKINSLKFHKTSQQTELFPYLWVTSGFLPPFDNNTSALHTFKVDAAASLQYLGSTKKPGSTLYYYTDLKNVSFRDGYYDLFTTEFWQPQYGVRRYLLYADIYNDSLRYYCADSVDNMRWVAQLTNDCYTRFTAERKKQDGTWEQVKFKNIQVDGYVYYPINGNYEPVVHNLAGWTEEKEGYLDGYMRMQLDLPIEDYVLGGKIRLNMKLYPEWADLNNLDGFEGYVLNKSYEADVLKNCDPKQGGCPFIYLKDVNNNYVVDNNILHRSEFSGSADITDKHKISITPQISSNVIELNLVENENDSSFINQVRFYAVDFPNTKKMGVTEGNLILLYDSTTVQAADTVLLYSGNNLNNITKNVYYYNPVSPANGNKTDSLYAHFSYSNGNTFRNKQQSVSKKAIDNDKRGKENSGERANSIISIKDGPTSSSLTYAFISDLRNLVYPIPAIKDTGGVLTATSVYSNQATGIFARRELNSVVILPLFGDSNKVSSFNIKWQSDFQMKYLGIATVEYNGYNLNELPLAGASYITRNSTSSIISNLANIDSSYGLVTDSGIIKIQFNAKNLPGLRYNYKREFVIEVNGHYFTGNSSMNTNVHKQLNVIPLKYQLSQNFPNPFNPSTKINYEIAGDNKVKLVIYDILGREVIKLVNDEFKKAGRYVVNFDGTNLASGVYFYRIEAGNFIQSKKMVLIK